MKDRNGKELSIGDSISVPDPDLWISAPNTNVSRIIVKIDKMTNLDGKIIVAKLPNGNLFPFYSPEVELIKTENKSAATTNTVAINDSVCKTCKNERVNKMERTCWRCGNRL